jgi:hypothetical protein
MHDRSRRRLTLSTAPFLFVIIFCLTPALTAQDFLPAPPADHTLIYFLDEQNKLISLPFEKAETPLHPGEIARGTKMSYLELKGEHSANVVPANTRIFLFTIDHGGAHPPLLVWLTPHKGARRVTAIAEKGRKGFAISTAEIIKPAARGLAKNGEEVFMELRPRVSLMPGEYAIIGEDLTRVVSFRVIGPSN